MTEPKREEIFETLTQKYTYQEVEEK